MTNSPTDSFVHRKPDETRVFLGIGSNLGDRQANIEHATRELASCLSHLRSASLYETAPQEVIDQPAFINTVVTGSTALGPLPLLEVIHSIEHVMGRDRLRERRKGPRMIDIDILLYGDELIASERLTIPHPAMRMRKFVLIPLLELDSELADPRDSTRFALLLSRLPPQGIYYFGAARYSG